MLFNKDNWNKLSKHKNGFIIVCGSPVYLLENDFVLHVRTSGKLATRLISVNKIDRDFMITGLLAKFSTIT